MKIYRTELEGHVIEARRNDLGAEKVLVDGRPMSHRPLAGLLGGSHHFDMPVVGGTERHVEVRWYDASRLKYGKYRVIINIDGVERCRLDPEPESRPVDLCRYCGYSLRGQQIANGEIRCPECGRHTPAAIVGREHADDAADLGRAE